MSVICGFGIGVSAGWGLFSVYCPKSENKYHYILLFAAASTLYTLKLSETFEDYIEIANTVALVTFPLLLAWTESWRTLGLTLSLMLISMLSTMIYAACTDNLTASFFMNLFSLISNVLLLLSLAFCSFFAAYGYSQIPDLLIMPPLKHFFNKNMLESCIENIQRAKSNIGYQYSCRGLPTPRFECNNLRCMEKELEDVMSKVKKMEKLKIDNTYFAITQAGLGAAVICVGFWVISCLIFLLVEGLVVSDCSWKCGFQITSRLSKSFEDIRLIINLLVGFFYLICVEIGFIKVIGAKEGECSSKILLGLIAMVCMASQCISALLVYFFSDHSNTETNIVHFCMQALMASSAFLFFIYWNFMKCKDR